MKTAFIIHGSFWNPDENWFPWLKTNLEEKGFKVIIPKFPTPENQSLNTWLKVFEKYENQIENSILVGHSLWPAFILNILEKTELKINSAIFVSWFLGLLWNAEFDKINKTFTDKDFNWNKIKKSCSNFKLFHSDNDPYVSLEKAKELASKLNSKLEIIKWAGHFNSWSWYLEFKKLLEAIN